MAYAFNDDKSKEEVYSKSEVDALQIDIKTLTGSLTRSNSYMKNIDFGNKQILILSLELSDDEDFENVYSIGSITGYTTLNDEQILFTKAYPYYRFSRYRDPISQNYYYSANIYGINLDYETYNQTVYYRLRYIEL